MKYQHVCRAVQETPWAIQPAKLATIIETLSLQAAGVKFSAEEIQARIGAPGRPENRTSGAVAVMPLYGVVSQRMNMMTEMSGGTSTEMFGSAFRQVMADPAIGALIIDVDSPGGSVFGVAELANSIYKARGQKPIVAVANSLAASAAYWIASMADEIVVTPGGLVGSIGVYSAHEDMSRMLEAEGVTVTEITAGKYKAEGSPYQPLDDEARAEMQHRVDTYYQMFTADVARGRGVPVRQVTGEFGQGRVFGAKEAVSLGMADRVATLDETIARLSGASKSRGARAEDETANVTAATVADIEIKVGCHDEFTEKLAAIASDSRKRRRLQALTHS